MERGLIEESLDRKKNASIFDAFLVNTKSRLGPERNNDLAAQCIDHQVLERENKMRENRDQTCDEDEG